jgi:NAD(P)-dependent dehydrogenase (short-subunit alcohol dehydrogenase family)
MVRSDLIAQISESFLYYFNMAVNPVVLILGAGPKVGASVATAFAKASYKVAVVSRTGTGRQTSEGFLSLKADLAQPEIIPQLFDAVKKEFDTAPNVVVYNAAALTPPPDQDSVLSVPHESLVSDLNINTISPYVAAQQALNGWKMLPKEIKKTFIYTGNKSNVQLMPVPLTMTLGVGKSASAYWIGLADKMNSAQGYR